MLFNQFNLKTLYPKLTKYFNSVYENNYWTLRYIKHEIIHSFNIYVLISFVFFIAMQLVFLPIYSVAFFCMLLVNVYKVYNYLYNPQQTEVVCGDNFRHFRSVWLEFTYNITFRRACVNSFTIVYKTLKLYKNYSSNKSITPGRAAIFVKMLLYFIMFVLWSLVLGVPFMIICRSFQYSRAFRSWRYSPLRPNKPHLLRVRIINNYQVRELNPGIFYRIYKANNTIWNFNPNYFSKNSNLLGEKLLKDGHIWYLYTLILHKMDVTYVRLPGSPTPHLTGFISGLLHKNMPYCCGTNLTSNSQYDSMVKYSDTPARKNPQIQTNLELWNSDRTETSPDHTSSGFQVVIKELHLSQWAFVFGTVFNSDGVSSLNLQPIFNHLVAEGFEFDSEVYDILLEANNYSNNLCQFMAKHQFTELELVAAKNSTMSELCPQIHDSVSTFTFNSKANKPLIILSDVDDSFI